MLNNNAYKRGQMGLSYEMVLNTNPCISYNMEENTTCLMLLVMAHAAYGHNAFFKNNYLFKMWTSPDTIVDYLVFAKKYIEECEEKYGYNEVEDVLDACHSLQNYGVDKYRHPPKLSVEKELERRRKMAGDDYKFVNDLWRTLPTKEKEMRVHDDAIKHKFPKQPQENILYFIEKNAPYMESWQREIVRIVRKIGQYFYPQGQTKCSNEGFASYTHYKIINKMYDEGYLPDGFMLEFIEHHTSVLAQPGFSSKYYYGFNPYTLGFNIYSDIERICKNPTEEDREWFPNLIGKDWLTEVHYAMENFKDESFIMQYLSPKVMRDMRMISIFDDADEPVWVVNGIHNKNGYKRIRETLANQYQRDRYVPDIQIDNVNVYGDRTLTLIHTSSDGKSVDDNSAESTCYYVQKLWGCPVELVHVYPDGDRETQVRVE